MLSGVAWLITLATLNAAAQLTLPQWVRARALSVYLLVSTGAQAIGAYVWGAVATRAGLDTALLWSAATLGVAALSVVVLPLRPMTGKLNVEVSTAWPEPMLLFEPRPHDGPVLVVVRYKVAEEQQDEFVEAMSRVRRSRLRTGGHSWRLYHSLERADVFLERFTVVSWSEFERQRSERWLGYDSENFT
jgi:MFS family permease